MKCEKCKLAIIEEELSHHVCFTGKIKNVRFDSGIPYLLEIFDGQKWLKCPNLKPYQPTGNTYNTTEEGTEPDIRKCYLLGCFFLLLISVGGSLIILVNSNLELLMEFASPIFVIELAILGTSLVTIFVTLWIGQRDKRRFLEPNTMNISKVS